MVLNKYPKFTDKTLTKVNKNVEIMDRVIVILGELWKNDKELILSPLKM